LPSKNCTLIWSSIDKENRWYWWIQKNLEIN
jgi:hypothetical protein